MSSLLRSTKFVRYFTGAARTLILNSAKTADANLLVNTKTLSAANSIHLRDYTTKKSESLEPLLQKLDSEVRRFGRITKKDIDEVFDEIRAKNDITSSQSLLVIRCCGELVPEELPEQRTLLVQKIWNVLTERGVPMDVSHYNALLRVYIENEHSFSPAQLLEEMEKKGLQPNRVTYQRLMWRYCQEGDIEGATRVLEKMRELNMPVSEPVLNALIMGHSFHGDTDGGKAVLDTMANAGLKPSNRSYALLACGYAKKGDIDGVENIIKIAKDQDNYLTDKDLLDIIEQLALGGHGDKVEQVFPHLNKTAGYNQEVCNLILKLLNRDQEDIAKKMMKTMPKSINTEDTMYKGAFYIKHLIKLNKSSDKIIQSCRDVQSEGLISNALYIATEAALTQGRAELAEKLLAEIKKDGMEVRQHYYWPILTQKGKERDEEGLLQVIKNMNTNGLQPTSEALRDYIIPYLLGQNSPQDVIVKLQLANIQTIHAARNVAVELLERGDIQIAANIIVMYRPRGQYHLFNRPLVNALVKTKDINSFVRILHVISSPQVIQEDTHEDVQSDDGSDAGRIVKIAVKNIWRDKLTEELLSALLSKGIRISSSYAQEIEQYLGNNMTMEISELLSKLTSPDLEVAPLESVRRKGQPRNGSDLEKLLKQNKNLENSNRLKKLVLLAYIKENNVDKVTSLVEEFKTVGFDFNLSLQAHLFEFYCDNDKIEIAQELQKEIEAKDPEFVLNPYKKILMAYALVRANRRDESIQYLIDNKPNSNQVESFIANSKAWQILNILAEAKDVANVKHLTQVLTENNYIQPNNVILGPLIKVHLQNDDMDGALKEFENCCKTYRCTPWKGELMKALILKEDASKLQWIADLSTQIHGEVNILHDLVLAFVECGKLRQARRILETPGLHTRQKRLQDACQRYVEEGKSEYLEGLLEATRELSHIDRSNIFYHLLVSYCKADETDKALGLWTLLQEEGEVPSEQFLIHLGSHLKSKNETVPFVMPELEKVEEPKKQSVPSTQKAVQPILTKKEVSDHIETLTQEEKTSQAMDYALKAIENGVIPKTNVLKFLLRKLADNGDIEKIQPLGKVINENTKRDVTFDDKLTLAIIVRGEGEQHLNNILNAMENSNNKEDIEAILRRYPRSNALAIIVQNSQLSLKCHKIAELAAAKGFHLPANLLWMEYLLAGKDKEADSLWQNCLINANVVVFRRLLQESHLKNQPETIKKLIEILETNSSISLASIGNAYSRLINLYIINKKIDEAKATYNCAIENGIPTEQFNLSTLKRLRESLKEAGKEVTF